MITWIPLNPSNHTLNDYRGWLQMNHDSYNMISEMEET